jgi:hypothetical protein
MKSEGKYINKTEHLKGYFIRAIKIDNKYRNFLRISPSNLLLDKPM